MTGAPAARRLAPTLTAIVEQVHEARHAGNVLDVVGGGTRARFTGRGGGTPLAVAAHRGIESYAPSELVVTARAGTPLAEIEDALAARGQMLGCEPPRSGPASTIGGVVASGLSGPARPWRGSVRDFVLGVELVNGQGEVLRFGGQVMKNVAGYDVPRLVTGACGSLGVITEVSLRVLPRPSCTSTLVWPLGAAAARKRMVELARAPWPVSAMAWDGAQLRVRVSGSAAAVEDAVARLAPPLVVREDPFWTRLRDFSEPCLVRRPGTVLWRLSLPPATPDADGATPLLLDWGGSLRWLREVGDAGALRRHVSAHGGHVAAYDTPEGALPQAPPAALVALMRRVKKAFDPDGVFSPQRLGAWFGTV